MVFFVCNVKLGKLSVLVVFLAVNQPCADGYNPALSALVSLMYKPSFLTIPLCLDIAVTVWERVFSLI